MSCLNCGLHIVEQIKSSVKYKCKNIMIVLLLHKFYLLWMCLTPKDCSRKKNVSPPPPTPPPPPGRHFLAHWWAYRIGRPLPSVCPSVIHTLSTSSPLKPLGRSVKFHMELLWDGGTKVSSNGPGHITKMAAMSIYGKNLINLLLRNPKADDLETWYAASGARVLPRLFKWWPWVDNDLF